MITKIYTDFKYLTSSKESHLNPIIWAQIDKISLEEKKRKHHFRYTSFNLVDNYKEADYWMLPNTWPHYVIGKSQHLAKQFSEMAFKNGKYVIVWSGGDPEWILPYKNAILFQEGIHKNIDRNHEFVFERPGFVEDYINLYFNNHWMPIFNEEPTIGFCGQADSRFISKIRFYIRNTITKLKYKFGISAYLPIIHGYPVNLRRKVLQLLSNSSSIKSDFIIRNQYLAGIRTKDSIIKKTHTTRIDFAHNIYNNIYTLCVRGTGNYSKRFYETLCCGRIPILLNTDSILPFEEFIDWEKHIIMIEIDEMNNISGIVNGFHKKHSKLELEKIQRSNRELWVNFLSTTGYYSHFHLYNNIILSKDLSN